MLNGDFLFNDDDVDDAYTDAGADADAGDDAADDDYDNIGRGNHNKYKHNKNHYEKK